MPSQSLPHRPSHNPLLLLPSLLFAGPALAQEKAGAEPPAMVSPVRAPSPDAVTSVWDFWFRGQGAGVVLADARLCLEVGRDGRDRFQCVREVPAEGVRANTPVFAWQAYLVPQGDSIEDLTVQVYQGETLRETKDVKVTGEGIRARNWTGVRLTRPGAWRVVIRRGDTVLKSIDVKVL
jgi:hypothetical protein